MRHRGPRACDVAGCQLRTQEGKPFCADHVDLHPYVRGLLDRIEAREDAALAAARREPVDVDGLLARELLRRLADEGGAATARRLCRYLDLTAVAFDWLTGALADAKRLERFETSRGALAVRLLSQETTRGEEEGQG